MDPEEKNHEPGQPDESHEIREQIADHDPTGQQGRPFMVSGFLIGLVLVLLVLVVIGAWVL